MEYWDKKELDEYPYDPKNWKWGIIYFNRKDKRIFVPKKDPRYGATVNFANPLSILAFSTPLLIIIILAVVFSIY